MKRINTHLAITIILMLFVSASWTSSCIGMLHKVKKGETLSGIARKYDVPMKRIVQTNSIASIDLLQIGEQLLIPLSTKPGNTTKEPDGTWYEVKVGDTLYNIARKHNIEDWKKLQQVNGISNPKRIKVGLTLFIPGDGDIGFALPLRIKLYVTSHYGYRNHPITGRYRLHEGIDFRAATGTRVYASKTGTVTYAARKGGYGKKVSIQHEDDFSTVYGHLSRIYVSVGDFVKQGQLIGLTGNSGHTTGPHLHFEVRYKGKSENPARHLDLR